MANEYDEEGGGSGFMVGLLTGTVLGAGLGMLFAPKSGNELRGQISGAASEQYQKVAKSANDLAEKGRDVVGRAKEAVNRGTEEARRYANQSQPQSGSSTSDFTGSSSSPYSPGPTRS